MKITSVITASLWILLGCSAAQIKLSESSSNNLDFTKLNGKLFLLISRYAADAETKIPEEDTKGLAETLSDYYQIETRDILPPESVKLDDSLKAFATATKTPIYVCSIVDGGSYLIEQEYLFDLKTAAASTKLKSIWLRNVEFSKLMTAAKNSVGAERIRSLDLALQALPPRNALLFHQDLIQEILSSDRPDTSELKAKYEALLAQPKTKAAASASPKVLEILRGLPANSSEQTVIEAIDKFLVSDTNSKYDKQYALMRKALILKRADKKEEAKQVFLEVIKEDESSKISGSARRLMEELSLPSTNKE